MPKMTIQVSDFYNVAKQIGLKRGDFTCKSPKDKNGEYQAMQICIFVKLSETQTRQLAKRYRVTVFKRNGVINWQRPLVSQDKAQLILIDLDEKDDYGYLYKILDN